MLLDSLRRADYAAFVVLRQRGHWKPLERACIWYSRAGDRSRIWFLVAGLGVLIDRRRGARRLYLRLSAAVTCTEIVNVLLKAAFRRGRPTLEALPPLAEARSRRSFPSAHAATSFAAARVLDNASPTVPVYTAASLMALTRPYLGVHYPSDVVAGIAVGIAIGKLASHGLTQPSPDRSG